jgi:hypothetical protein
VTVSVHCTVAFIYCIQVVDVQSRNKVGKDVQCSSHYRKDAAVCSSHDREETTYSSRERWWVIIVKRINTVYFILLKYFTINFFNSRLFFLPFVVGSSMTSDALCEALGIHVEVTVAITLTEAGAASI